MDTSQKTALAETAKINQKADVSAAIDHIKRNLPSVYDMILSRAKEKGKEAYAHVRAGLRGEVNRFYAFERGYVVGTPFACPAITDAIAGCMVQYGVTAVVIWAPEPTDGGGVASGTN